MDNSPTADSLPEVAWETEIAELLSMLSATQGEMLELLGEKRQALVDGDSQRLTAIGPREESLVARLSECQQRRASLLESAAEHGLPAGSIEALSAAVTGDESHERQNEIRDAKQQARLLQHHSLTSWVLVQRTVLHLSQLLEIIATGGQMQPTYGKGGTSSASGSLVDQAV